MTIFKCSCMHGRCETGNEEKKLAKFTERAYTTQYHGMVLLLHYESHSENVKYTEVCILDKKANKIYAHRNKLIICDRP